jgi:hypothetical protein
MWAIGDASTIATPKALDYADELFELADTDGNGVLSLAELRVGFDVASRHVASMLPCCKAACYHSTFDTISFLYIHQLRTITLCCAVDCNLIAHH